VILCDGELIAYLSRTGHNLQTFLPDDEAARPGVELAIAEALKRMVDELSRRTLEIKDIDGRRAREAPFGAVLLAAGFTATNDGYFYVGTTHSVAG
jgi:hypothetical protein